MRDVRSMLRREEFALGTGRAKKHCGTGATTICRREEFVICKTQGAKVTKYTCRYEGCTNNAKNGGVCKRHELIMSSAVVVGSS